MVWNRTFWGCACSSTHSQIKVKRMSWPVAELDFPEPAFRDGRLPLHWRIAIRSIAAVHSLLTVFGETARLQFKAVGGQALSAPAALANNKRDKALGASQASKLCQYDNSRNNAGAALASRNTCWPAMAGRNSPASKGAAADTKCRLLTPLGMWRLV